MGLDQGSPPHQHASPITRGSTFPITLPEGLLAQAHSPVDELCTRSPLDLGELAVRRPQDPRLGAIAGNPLSANQTTRDQLNGIRVEGTSLIGHSHSPAGSRTTTRGSHNC